MAENKKSFVLYADYLEIFEELSDEDAGQLVKHLFRYVNDKNPETENPMVKLSFISIKQQLKRDLKKWEVGKTGKSQAGALGNLKRWYNDLYMDVINEKITLDEALEIAKNRKESHSDFSESQTSQEVANIAVNVDVNVNDTVDVNNVLLEKEPKEKKIDKKKFNYRTELLKIVGHDKVQLVDDYILHRKTRKAPLSKTALDLLTKECNENDFDVGTALEISIEKNWQGFKVEWLNKEKTAPNGKQYPNTGNKTGYKFDLNRAIASTTGGTK